MADNAVYRAVSVYSDGRRYAHSIRKSLGSAKLDRTRELKYRQNPSRDKIVIEVAFLDWYEIEEE